jgi:hypothetical protein
MLPGEAKSGEAKSEIRISKSETNPATTGLAPVEHSLDSYHE